MHMEFDSDHCYEAIKARDSRFDGVFFVGVSTTGVYCRPVCTARTPRQDRCSFFANAASAEASGYRPCLRCRPELAPGFAPVDSVKRVANAAVARIDEGALTDLSVGDLAREFGIGARQLHRVIEADYGVHPLALAQTRRLLLAKQLLTDTALRVVDIAFASGFSSVRQFNRQFRQSYRLNPLALRKQRAKQASPGIVLKLGFRPPLAWRPLIQFLAGRAALSSERIDGDNYFRTMRIGNHSGWISAAPIAVNLIKVEVAPALLPVLSEVQARIRQLFDLDANPAVIDERLAANRVLRARVQRTPGLRVPGAISGFELALRAVLGQQITVKAATTIFERFVTTFGTKVDTPFEGVTHVAPDAATIADATLQQLMDRGLTRKRAETAAALARAVADGTVQMNRSADLPSVRESLLSIAGIGPWTAEYVAMRALGDPDAFPSSDLGLMRALNIQKAAQLQETAEAWRPWRAYAALHLWNSLGNGG